MIYFINKNARIWQNFVTVTQITIHQFSAYEKQYWLQYKKTPQGI